MPDLVQATVRGRNELFVAADAAFGIAQKHPMHWYVMRSPHSIPSHLDPLVVEVVEDTSQSLFVYTDTNMREGVTYYIYLAAQFPGGADPSVLEVVGMRQTSFERPRDMLMDIDASPFGGWRLTADGDLARRGGFATLRKIVLDTELTPLGSLWWAPEHGAEQQHKKLRAVDLGAEERRRAKRLAAIPGVLSAQVRLTFRSGHLVSALRLQTEFGLLSESVDLSGGVVL